MKQNYIIDRNTKIIGVGMFGKVFQTHHRHDKTFQVAIKVLDKQKAGDEIEQIFIEVDNLHKLDHPNIVKYFETYNDSKYIYLVMEFVQGK